MFPVSLFQLSALSGWGWGVFTGYNHWWLVPVTACHVGGVLGAFLYWLLLSKEGQQSGGQHTVEEDFMKEAGLAELSTSNYLQVRLRERERVR